MTTDTKNAWAGAAVSAGSGFTEAVRRAWHEYEHKRENRKAVARMQAMSDRELKDIGVERWQIEQAVYGGRRALKTNGK